MTKHNDDCPYCGRDTGGSGVTAGNNRIACEVCYKQNHPPVQISTIQQALRGQDPSLGYQLVTAYLTEENMKRVVHDYNYRTMERYCITLAKLVEERLVEKGE